MHNNANIPMEMIESDMPLTFLGYGLLTGLRRRRAAIAAASGCGASGASIAPRRSSPPTSTASSFRPFGLDGGEPAALERALL